MTSATLVVVPLDRLEALIRAAVRSEVGAVEKPAIPNRALLTAVQVQREYRIGRRALLEYGNANRLPFVERPARGGGMARYYTRDDCNRVLADTLHRF